MSKHTITAAQARRATAKHPEARAEVNRAKAIRDRDTERTRMDRLIAALGSSIVYEREFQFDAARKWRLDLAIFAPALSSSWPNLTEPFVAVEIHGGARGKGRHTSTGAVGDWEKLNAAQLAGWMVLQYPGHMLDTPKGLAKIVAEIKRALGEK